MPIRHAVLGLLLERRGYGYELAQRLAARLGPAWQLRPTAIYSALDQLEADAQIVGTLHEPLSTRGGIARRPGRVVYEPTQAGADAFREWLARPTSQREPIRADLYLKLAVARSADIEGLLVLIDHEQRTVRQLAEDCAEPAGEPRGDLVRAAAVARLSGELAWIDSARDALRALR